MTVMGSLTVCPSLAQANVPVRFHSISIDIYGRVPRKKDATKQTGLLSVEFRNTLLPQAHDHGCPWTMDVSLSLNFLVHLRDVRSCGVRCVEDSSAGWKMEV